MNEHRRHRLSLVAFAAAILLYIPSCVAQPARVEGTQILVRPITQEGVARIGELRKRLGISRESNLPSIYAGLWTSPQSPGAVEAVVREYRPGIAAEVLRHDHRIVAWPADEKELTAAARANYERIRPLRSYADGKKTGIVKMLSPAFAAPMLRNGLREERGHFGAPRSLKWRLLPGTEFHSTRVGLKLGAGGSFAWVGELRVPGMNPASKYEHGFGAASYQNGHIYARFEYGDSIYQLVPLGDQFHLAMRVEPKGVPEGEPDRVKDVDTGTGEPDIPPGGDCSFGEYDRAKDVDTGTGEPDRVKDVDTGTGEPDQVRDVDVGTGEPDKVKDVDTGTGEPDLYAGFCAPMCSPTPWVRGGMCSEGPRSCATIRIGIGVTRQALAQLPGISATGLGVTDSPTVLNARHYAQYLVDLASASFTRSGISARLSLGDVAILDDLEAQHTNAWQVVDALTRPAASPSVQAIHAWRTASGSDVVMILSTLDRMPSGALIGGMSPPSKRVKDPKSAYSVVVARFADAQLSFLHELGHHLGAYHDPKAGTGNPPFPYAQGFRKGCEWRTVMAYDGGDCRSGTPRLAMWSSCNLWYRGVLAGGVDQNNVRIINRMSGWVAGFRP